MADKNYVVLKGTEKDAYPTFLEDEGEGRYTHWQGIYGTSGILLPGHEVIPVKGVKLEAKLAAYVALHEAAVNRLRMTFHARPDAAGNVHVQNMVAGYFGQHHVHTRADFETWRKDTEVTISEEICTCGMEPGAVNDRADKSYLHGGWQEVTA